MVASGFAARLERLDPLSAQLKEGLSWVVRVGWLRGKVDRDRMADWCESTLPWEGPEAMRWQYDKGGNWYFRDEEDAVMFLLAWA